MNDNTLPSVDENILSRFEEAWDQGSQPAISDHLPPPSDPRYQATLEELAFVDLEFGFKRWQENQDAAEPRIESYLAKFPELNDQRVVKRLIREEAHVRRRLGQSVSAAEYESRFPGVVTESDLEAQGSLGAYVPRTVVVGDQVGPYQLMHKLGEGGFGVVYLAEQTKPVRRKVALKVVKPGMDTAAVVARFEAERQALALMDHENIARVLDAGATENGRPFFVMELVKGVPITDYCDRHRLTTQQRVELFIKVCQAIQHAHHKGIIHRDIKPSNILVTAKENQAIPKVIDFGVAKALDQQLTDHTMFTRLGQVMGTPLYMSPEQAQADATDVDTRTDVYSLGVLLYELLTGTTPIPVEDFRQAALDEMLRLIREGEPPKPSTRISESGEAVSAISDKRNIEPKKLGTLMRGDLDWIVMKALEKDRTRRYETASALADDMRRYLENEPVLAGPPSFVYRFGKLAKKYRAAIVTAAGIAALLMAATVTSTTFYFRANRARMAEQVARHEAEAAEQQATQQAEVATAVTAFLTDDVLAQADPSASPDPNIKLRTVLDQAAEKVEGQFSDKPAVEAAVRYAIGVSYMGLGEYETAEPHLKQSSELRALHLGKDAAPTLSSTHGLATLYFYRGRVEDAERMIKETLQRRQRVLGLTHDDTLASMNDLAGVYATAGRFDEAEQLYDEAIAQATKSHGSDHDVTQAFILHLTDLYQMQGRFDDAEPLLKKSLESLEEKLGPDHPLTMKSLLHLAELYLRKGLAKESESLFEETILRAERALGPDHPFTLEARNDLCVLYDTQGRYAESEVLVSEILESRRKVLGPDHYYTIISMNNLATAYYRLGKFDDAQEMFEQTVEASARVRGEEHPFTLQASSNLAMVYHTQGKLDKALRQHERLLESREAKLGPAHPDTLISMSAVATLYNAQGQEKKAEAMFKKILEVQEGLLGNEHPHVLSIRSNLARVYSSQGRHKEAEQVLDQILGTRTRTLGAEHPDTLPVANQLAEVYIEQFRYAEAEELSRKTLEALRRVKGDLHPDTLISMNDLALALSRQGSYGEALPLYAETLEEQSSTLGAEHHTSVVTQVNLGRLYIKLKRYDEAEPLLTAALRTRKRISGSEHRETLWSMDDLAQLRMHQGRAAEAEELFQETIEIEKRVLGTDDATTLTTMQRLAEFYLGEQRYEDARSILAVVLESRQRVLGSDNAISQVSLRQMCATLLHLERFHEAEPLCREALLWAEQNASQTWALPSATSIMGAALAGQRKFAEAEPLLIEGFAGLATATDLQLKDSLDSARLDAARRLVQLYEAWEKPAAAKRWAATVAELEVR